MEKYKFSPFNRGFTLFEQVDSIFVNDAGKFIISEVPGCYSGQEGGLTYIRLSYLDAETRDLVYEFLLDQRVVSDWNLTKKDQETGPYLLIIHREWVTLALFAILDVMPLNLLIKTRFDCIRLTLLRVEECKEYVPMFLFTATKDTTSFKYAWNRNIRPKRKVVQLKKSPIWHACDSCLKVKVSAKPNKDLGVDFNIMTGPSLGVITLTNSITRNPACQTVSLAFSYEKNDLYWANDVIRTKDLLHQRWAIEQIAPKNLGDLFFGRLFFSTLFRLMYNDLGEIPKVGPGHSLSNLISLVRDSHEKNKMP